MSLIKLRQTWRDFRRSHRGMAGVELALSAPLLITLCFGGFELARHSLLNLKMEKVAFTIADVIAQNETLTNSQIDDVFEVADQIAAPFTMDNVGVAYVTSAYLAEGDQYPTVLWQRSGAGTAANASQVGSEGLTATLPNNLTLNERDNVIVAEVYYLYTPIFTLGGVFSASTIYKTTIFKPRLGDLTTSPT